MTRDEQRMLEELGEVIERLLSVPDVVVSKPGEPLKFRLAEAFVTLIVEPKVKYPERGHHD